MTKADIHPTHPDDIPGLQQVLHETDLFPPNLLPDLLAQGGADTWLSSHVNGAAVGLGLTAPDPMTDGTWTMRALPVRPEVQGQGLGATLVTASEDRLRSLGARLQLLDTSGTDAFTATRAFYVAQGYEREARIRNFWAGGDDKVTFRKRL